MSDVDIGSHLAPFYYLSNGADRDECKMGISGCEQICQNTPTSYSCRCYNGYTLRPDLHTCQSETFNLLFNQLTYNFISSLSQNGIFYSNFVLKHCSQGIYLIKRQDLGAYLTFLTGGQKTNT